MYDRRVIQEKVMEELATREPIPAKVLKVLARLREAGFEAYLVGGCVRDRLLQRKTNDWDITTNATPHEVTAVFDRVIPTGIDHGTVTVMLEGDGYEVTTYRVDVSYSDGRRPDAVEFTPSLAEDLARRDFTINAIAYDPIDNVLVDIYEGRTDLRGRRIRAVGVALDRLSEDGLRSFRAVRFASQLGFEIDEDLADAITKTLDVFALVSAERIQIELRKTLLSGRATWGVETLLSTGLLGVFLPDVAGVEPETLQRSLDAVSRAEENFEVRMAVLLTCVPKATEAACRSLKLSNHARRLIVHLVEMAEYDIDSGSDGAVFRLASMVGLENWSMFLAFRRALDVEMSDKIETLSVRGDSLDIMNAPLNTQGLAIDGQNVMERLGIEPSPRIRLVLQGCLEAIWDGHLKNEHEVLMAALPDIDAKVEER